MGQILLDHGTYYLWSLAKMAGLGGSWTTSGGPQVNHPWSTQFLAQWGIHVAAIKIIDLAGTLADYNVFKNTNGGFTHGCLYITTHFINKISSEALTIMPNMHGPNVILSLANLSPSLLYLWFNKYNYSSVVCLKVCALTSPNLKPRRINVKVKELISCKYILLHPDVLDAPG